MPIAITMETSRPTTLMLRTAATSSPLSPPKARPTGGSSWKALALAPPKSSASLLRFSSALVAQLRTSSIILLFLLFYYLAIPTQINAHCYNNGNFTANSTYAGNRRLLLSSLPFKVEANGGFFSGSLGTSPDTVFALSFCRGDLPAQNLTAFANSTSMGLMESCPSQKQGAAFEDGFCNVRYSDSPIYGILDMSIPLMVYNTMDLGMSWDSFNQTWWNHLESLAVTASKGSTRLKFATGEASLPDSRTIYALLQCSPDLSESDCLRCLIHSIGDYQNCCRGKSGGGVVWPSCYLRWDLYYFYMYSPAPPPPSPPPPASPPPPPPSPPPPPLGAPLPTSTNTTSIEKDDWDKGSLVIAIIVPTISFLIIVIVIIVLLYRRRLKLPWKLKDPTIAFLASTEDWLSGNDSSLFKLSEIRAATNDFSDTNKLGQGGFGKVYKGKLNGGQQIAVKRLEGCSNEGEKQFKNEIMFMARLRHRNLVKLVGYCFEGGERIIIYEFVPYASLDRFISDPNKRVLLDWMKRYKIIKGIARGLLYLHVDSQLRLIHRDLKPANILLDEKMNPKIADFGTGRLFASDQSKERTRNIAGTYGYMPPEYVQRGEISLKTDVFSFGVMILEIISGQKNGCLNISGSSSHLASYAWNNWKKGTAMNLVDPFLKGSPVGEILGCIHIALLCVQEDVARRPTMATITLMLSTESQSLPMPSHPAFLTDSSMTNNRAPAQIEWPSACSTPASINELSFSNMYPR
ncbi:putative cysteine-rich receptor-like protein kinase 35 isoform X3 [Punica granatum]|uniref:Cysteine-rich receptor-like protein kinase 35 isoform X3 n=1 Tax=Punica granatum TaxID=22663 RepID=A0A6P8DDR7_PUNGR|nr:putative cysteine-rich receptor-like protein kinase 35 isoform X3 [Punica granatum]